MFTDTINKCAANAARIARLSANNPLGFWVSSAMAGAYVGLGIILIFTLGNLLDPSIRPLVMGATFGIALTLVIIAVLNCSRTHHVPHLWGESGHHQPRANVGNPAANLAG